MTNAVWVRALGIAAIVVISAAWLLVMDAKGTHSQETMGPEAMKRAEVNMKCKECHDQIWPEWYDSPHAHAYTSTTYKELAGKEGDKADTCDTCHAPEPIQTTGLQTKPKLRSSDTGMGVDCIACHMDAEGAMHGPFFTSSTFHKAVQDNQYKGSPATCVPCHGQMTAPNYDQVTAFTKAKPIANQPDLSCQTCHMPEIERRATNVQGTRVRITGDHRILGPSNPDLLRGAAKLTLSVEDGALILRVTNRAAHKLPAGGWREVDLEVTLVDGKGAEESKPFFVHSFALPGSGGKDTRIAGFQTLPLIASLPHRSVKAVRARLWYKPLPTTPPEQRVLMTSAEATL